MSQVTNPIILNNTGQDIALALTGLATAIASKPDPATQTPVMDGAGDIGASAKYAREDHQHPSDTTKANQAQLAVVETGTTASVAHAVGEYFCWNGLLYRATAPISVGQSFTPGTNCYQTTAMDMVPPRISGGDLNDYTTPGVYMWPVTAATMPTNVPLATQSVMIVLQASSADRVCQIVFAHDATRNGVFYRWLFADAWTSWYTIG